LDPTARGKYFAKFFVEIRLKSKLLFEHLICFVVFLLQKLWQKKKTNLGKNYPKLFFTQILVIFANFQTRNPRQPIKGSKDSDFSIVVSSKNVSEILPSCSWGQRPSNLSQNC